MPLVGHESAQPGKINLHGKIRNRLLRPQIVISGMLGEEIAYERTMGDDFKPACAHGFERAGDQPRGEPVAAGLRRHLSVRECDDVAREPLISHGQDAVVVHFEPGELGVIV